MKRDSTTQDTRRVQLGDCRRTNRTAPSPLRLWPRTLGQRRIALSSAMTRVWSSSVIVVYSGMLIIRSKALSATG